MMMLLLLLCRSVHRMVVTVRLPRCVTMPVAQLRVGVAQRLARRLDVAARDVNVKVPHRRRGGDRRSARRRRRKRDGGHSVARDTGAPAREILDDVA